MTVYAVSAVLGEGVLNRCDLALYSAELPALNHAEYLLRWAQLCALMGIQRVEVVQREVHQVKEVKA